MDALSILHVKVESSEFIITEPNAIRFFSILKCKSEILIEYPGHAFVNSFMILLLKYPFIYISGKKSKTRRQSNTMTPATRLE
jgi:hypothetical protein